MKGKQEQINCKSSAALPMPINHIDGLDGLRGIAVIGVILYHLFPNTVKGGFLGVSLFFVLSGYLIAWTSEKYCAAGGFEFAAFYKKRFQRIYPSLLIVVFVTAGILRLVDPHLINGMREEVFSVFLGYNNLWQISQNSSYFTQIANASPFTHLWSLAIELQFYLIWPLLYIVYQKTKKKYSLYVFRIPMILSFLSLEILFQPGEDVTSVYYGTITRMFSLFLGVLLAVKSKRKRARRLTRNRIRKKILYFWILFAVLVLAYLFMDGQSAFTYRIGLFVTSILFYELMKLATDSQLPIGKWLDWKPLAWIGKRSYEIYLWQYPVIFVFQYFQWKCFGLAPLLIVTIIFLLSTWLQEVLKWLKIKCGGKNDMKQIKKFSFGILTSFLAVTFVLGGCSVANDPNTKKESQKQLQEELEKNSEILEKQQAAGEQGNINSVGTNDIQQINETDEESTMDSVVAIGDSVMLGASPSIQERIPGCVVDASESRQVVQVGEVIQELEQKGALGDTVIIGLGTNGSFSMESGQSVIDQLGSERTIYWITAYGQHLQWQDSSNEMIARLAEQNDNVQVIDWAEQASSHPEWFYDDGIHLNSAGQEAYAEMILEYIS